MNRLKNESLVRMYAHEPCCLTVKEYERLTYEIRGRLLTVVSGCEVLTISDRILIRMLYDNSYRYGEIRGDNIPVDVKEFINQIATKRIDAAMGGAVK